MYGNCMQTSKYYIMQYMAYKVYEIHFRAKKRVLGISNFAQKIDPTPVGQIRICIKASFECFLMHKPD